MNLKAIKAKLDGSLSKEDFELLKQSIDAEIKAVEQAMAALDAEKSSYAEVLHETEHESVDFMQAWKDGNVHRKKEIQTALFSEGLTYWHKKMNFEQTKGLSPEEGWEKIDEWCQIGGALHLNEHNGGLEEVTQCGPYAGSRL